MIESKKGDKSLECFEGFWEDAKLPNCACEASELHREVSTGAELVVVV